MSGLAFERARARVHETLLAGSMEVESELANAHRVQADMIVALHSGVPRAEVLEWAGRLGFQCVQAVADGGDPVSVCAGAYAQGMLTGLFLAQEISKAGER